MATFCFVASLGFRLGRRGKKVEVEVVVRMKNVVVYGTILKCLDFGSTSCNV